ncbi:hypothetical protein AXG93_146s1320 [Marchantia polymorpha subsp. ruderalis]|uniref:Uncharacterized protein n=1 Tax=Marchantia polymorpha subsp. ruderalis TaxID=1480154 RepID=A0A176W9L4_MARPO|nr:hypothetical protein AXG93_146s1320 [Marchantia polymorpha subsp. ruderalis]
MPGGVPDLDLKAAREFCQDEDSVDKEQGRMTYSQLPPLLVFLSQSQLDMMTGWAGRSQQLLGPAPLAIGHGSSSGGKQT